MIDCQVKCNRLRKKLFKHLKWKFGMKCNIGADAGSGLVHSITATSFTKG